MKKNRLITILLLSAVLYGCSTQETDKEPQTELVKTGFPEINEEEQNSGWESGIEERSTEIEDIGTEDIKVESMEMEDNNRVDSQAASEADVPTKEEVLAVREQVLEGMSAEEIERLQENIKVANQQMESAYLNDNIFERLEDEESLYWNYFDEKGDIQVGWIYEGSYQEMRDIMKENDLSQEEFYSQYGTPVTIYNRFDAQNFIELFQEMKTAVKDEKLQDDLQRLIDETDLAAQTHEMEHAYRIYQLLHDMDYYLLRFGPEDVGKYVRDASTVVKYYGVLSVYD